MSSHQSSDFVKQLLILMPTKQKKNNSFDFQDYKHTNVTNFLHGRKIMKRRNSTKQSIENPVYNVLKNQRNKKHVFDFIFAHIPRTSTAPLSDFRSRQLFTSPSVTSNNSNQHERNSSKEICKFRNRANSIYQRMARMTEQMKQKKKQLNILDSYNNIMDKYCGYISTNPDEDINSKESNYDNERLIKLCVEDFFPKESLHKRAYSLLTYTEPKIPAKRLRILKNRHQNKFHPAMNEIPKTPSPLQFLINL